MVPLKGAAPVDRQEAGEAAADSPMEAEEAEECLTEEVEGEVLWTVVAGVEALKAEGVVDHDVSEKSRPWRRQGRVERLLKSSTTSLKKTFH